MRWHEDEAERESVYEMHRVLECDIESQKKHDAAPGTENSPPFRVRVRVRVRMQCQGPKVVLESNDNKLWLVLRLDYEHVRLPLVGEGRDACENTV